MATTTSTLSPLVAGAADLARKLAAYKATSNSQQQGVQEGDDRTYQEIPSPLDVSFGPQHTATNFFRYLFMHLIVENKNFCSMGPKTPLFVRESSLRTTGFRASLS